MKYVVLSALIASFFTSCATTTFYVDGKPVARFQGDMTGMKYSRSAKGAITWEGDVAHSPATAAGGEAANARLTGAGLGITALAKVIPAL